MWLALLLACRVAAPPPGALDAAIEPGPGEALVILRGDGEPAFHVGSVVDLYAVEHRSGGIVVHDARVTRSEPGLLVVAITTEEAGFLEEAQARPGVKITADPRAVGGRYDAIEPSSGVEEQPGVRRRR